MGLSLAIWKARALSLEPAAVLLGVQIIYLLLLIALNAGAHLLVRTFFYEEWISSHSKKENKKISVPENAGAAPALDVPVSPADEENENAP